MQILSNILESLLGKRKASQPQNISVEPVDLVPQSAAFEKLLAAFGHLQVVEQLLVDPTPEKIQLASVLMNEANQAVISFVKFFQKHADEQNGQEQEEVTRCIRLFEQVSGRVTRLLEGALRVQWGRMRWIGVLTQSYTPVGKLKTWQPPACKMHVEA